MAERELTIETGQQVHVGSGQGGGITAKIGTIRTAPNTTVSELTRASAFVWGMDIQEALDYPRFFCRDGVCGLEEGVPETVAAGLADRGHSVERVAEPWGGGQGIVIDRETGMLVGGCDPRKDSLALGF